MANIELIEVFFIDDTKNQLHIHTNDELTMYKLYWTFDNDVHTTNKEYLLTSNEKDLIFDFQYSKEKRTYFIFEYENASLLFSYRILPVDGLYNLRDIGGYKTSDGKRIKWGVGFRSDYLIQVQESSMEYIKNLKIKTIIDYRSPDEIEQSPNKNIGENETFVCNPNASIAEMAGALQSGESADGSREHMVDHARKQIANGIENGDENMVRQQLSFVSEPRAQEAFSKALSVLANESHAPSLQHCRGGKDRTGFGLMLLEGILGVSENDMVYDYLLTRKAREEKSKRYYENFLKMAEGDIKVADYMFSLFDTKDIYIQASMKRIKNDYGSICAYAKDVLHIDDEQIEVLKGIYLEDTEI